MHCNPFEIYPPTGCHNHSKYSFGDMHRTKFRFESKQRAITQKISKQELHALHSPLMRSIHPQNFITIASIVSEIGPGQNSRKNSASKSYGSRALHSPLMRSIHPQDFITIASIVLEICSGQNSSMKINKGQ